MQGKPVQIHHIDENPSNHAVKNLAALCFGCHDLTQVSGGFSRKLDAEQVVLYRDDWTRVVARNRVLTEKQELHFDDNASEIEFVTTKAEILREREQWDLLAMHYHAYGSYELRDKYIERALSRDQVPVDLELSLRSIQGKLDMVDEKKLEVLLSNLLGEKDFLQLARRYQTLKDSKKALRYYCLGLLQCLKEGATFSAAYYVKELSEEKIYEPLFKAALDVAAETDDVWWQLRCYEELDWHKEHDRLLIDNREKIEADGDLLLLEKLYTAVGNREKLLEVTKSIAESEASVAMGDGQMVINIPLPLRSGNDDPNHSEPEADESLSSSKK
jgi:hypothetical protein